MQQSAESSRVILAAAFSIYHKCQEHAFLFTMLLIIVTILTLNNQTVVIMELEKIINDAVREHNLTNPVFIIHKIQSDAFEWYYLYCEDGNKWYTEELRLFLYLYRKLSQERVYPFISVWEINGEDRIGIFIPDILVL